MQLLKQNTNMNQESKMEALPIDSNRQHRQTRVMHHQWVHETKGLRESVETMVVKTELV